MRRITILILVALALAASGVFIFMSPRTLPEELVLEPSEANALPCRILLTGEETLTLCLPGNTDPSACFFSWEGGSKGQCGGRKYVSGEMPVPMPGETATYTFRSGKESAEFKVRTLQGSSGVQPIFIEIDEEKGTIAAMNEDPGHDASCSGEIFIGGEAHTLSRIKGRGNWSWQVSTDKKPYNLKLEEKIKVEGLDSEATRQYSLLAETGDHSLLRNAIGYGLGHEMGIGQAFVYTDVWMNGRYRGLYLLTPKTDAYVPDEGYLVENDDYCEPPISEGGDPSFTLEGLYGSNGTDLVNNKDNRITVKKIGSSLLTGADGEKDESEENVMKVTEEIRSHLQEAWDAVRSPDGFNAQGKHYTEYLDITSFAKMFLLLEYCKDFDACCGSKYFLRRGTGSDDLLYAMPVWDLDNALGTCRNNTRLLLHEEIGLSSAYGAFFANIRDLPRSFYRTLGTHEDFMAEVVRVYRENKALFDAVPDRIDALSAEIASSAGMNFLTMDPLDDSSLARYEEKTVRNADTPYEQVYEATPDGRTDWAVYVANLREFCSVRSRFLADEMEKGTYGKTMPDAQPEAFRFEDLQDEEAYYYVPAYWAVNHIPQITAGSGSNRFGPDSECTLGQALSFLYNAAGRPEAPRPENEYTDVPESSLFFDDVAWAEANGILKGREEDRFGVEDSITRAEFVDMLYRYAGSPPAGDAGASFSDVEPGDRWFEAVCWATQEKITAGSEGGAFCPNRVCTRAEAVTFLYRLMNGSGD